MASAYVCVRYGAILIWGVVYALSLLNVVLFIIIARNLCVYCFVLLLSADVMVPDSVQCTEYILLQ